MELQKVKKTVVGILLFFTLSGLCGCGSRPEEPVLPEQHQQQNQQQPQQYRAEYFQSFVCLLCHRISLIFA